MDSRSFSFWRDNLLLVSSFSLLGMASVFKLTINGQCRYRVWPVIARAWRVVWAKIRLLAFEKWRRLKFWQKFACYKELQTLFLCYRCTVQRQRIDQRNIFIRKRTSPCSFPLLVTSLWEPWLHRKDHQHPKPRNTLNITEWSMLTTQTS